MASLSRHSMRLLSHHFLGFLCRILLLISLFFPHFAQAQYAGTLTNNARYDNCTVTTSINGQTTFRVRAHLVSSSIYLNQQQKYFSTWGVAVFFYDGSGNRKVSPASTIVRMNAIDSPSRYYYSPVPSLTIYSGPTDGSTTPLYTSNWHRLNAGAVDIEVSVKSIDIAEFPAIVLAMSLREKTFSSSYIDTLYALLSESEAAGAGACNMILPGTKPPAPKKKLLTVKVPDWDFGELKANDPNQNIPLTEKFCLEYEAAGIYSEKITLNVSNQNGTTIESGSKFFKLLHSNGSGAYIPYAMRLNGSGLTGGVYRMPNSGATSFATNNFSATGKTCFDATYTSRTLPTSVPGDYTDTLTFTISNVP